MYSSGLLDLLTIPPGFTEGISLDNSSSVNTENVDQVSTPSTTTKAAQSVTISELLFGSDSGGADQFIDWGEEGGEGKVQVEVDDDVSIVCYGIRKISINRKNVEMYKLLLHWLVRV